MNHLPKMLYSLDELTIVLGLPRRTVWQLVRKGEMPAPLTLGNVQRWRAKDINNWIDGLSAAPVGDAPGEGQAPEPEAAAEVAAPSGL